MDAEYVAARSLQGADRAEWFFERAQKEQEAMSLSDN